MAVNHHFVNHYANVNDTLKKGHPSWKKQAHAYVVRSNHDLPHLAGQSSSSNYHQNNNPYGPSTSHSSSQNMLNGGHSLNNGNLIGNNGHSNLPPLPTNSHSINNLNMSSNMGNSMNNNMGNSMNNNMNNSMSNNMNNSMSNNLNHQMNNSNINNSMNTSNNMNDLHPSFNKQRISPQAISSQIPAPQMPPPSYNHTMMNTEESDLDSPVNNLNGGRIVMNNMAGSRLPLPGFSSFV